MTHAVVGGALSVAQGGSFLESFASAGLGSVGGFAGADVVGNNPDGLFARTAFAATAGGLASELTGGKFANGAITASFAHLFNDEAPNMKAQFTTAGVYVGSAVGMAAGGGMTITSGGLNAPFIPEETWLGGAIGGTIGHGVGIVYDIFYSDGVTDIDSSTPGFRGEPGSVVRGETQTRLYGEDGFPLIDRDLGHPDESGIGCGDHCHDWGRPDGGAPTHLDRGPPPTPYAWGSSSA